MKITCDREKLATAFQAAAAIAPTRSPKAILQSIKLDVTDGSALMTATDLEIGIRIEVPGIRVEQDGSVVLPIQRFHSVLKESSDATLSLEADDKGIVVRGQHSEFRFPAASPHEFPAVAAFEATQYHDVPARLLREMIRRTVFATDNESSRYALGGVLLEFDSDKLTAVGTDGRRLAKMEGPAAAVQGHPATDQMTIVPTKAMQLIERSLSDADAEVQLAVRSNDVLIQGPRMTIYSRLVEGRFPKWRDVFPQRQDAIKIEMLVGPFHSVVRQAAIATNEESRGVDFTFGEGKLVLAGSAAEVGQARVEMPIEYGGAPVSIMLDPRFVADFLRVLDPEKSITFELANSESAAVCTTDDGYGYVIMPLARDR